MVPHYFKYKNTLSYVKHFIPVDELLPIPRQKVNDCHHSLFTNQIMQYIIISVGTGRTKKPICFIDLAAHKMLFITNLIIK